MATIFKLLVSDYLPLFCKYIITYKWPEIIADLPNLF